MDLRTTFPRSLKERLGPYLHLPRMIDKCRAKRAGTLGEYIYPCPLDARFLEFTSIQADDLFMAVESRTDEEVLEWVSHHATNRTDQEIQDWNAMMLTRGPDTEEKRLFFREVRASIDPSRHDITAWADLLDLEEGRDVPIRNPVEPAP
ncbi:MAG: hypothetical protein NPIRA02_29840 [Nitrospirales bacterium]|nr:MAG: hypothetical protein NPIRA02_29840 [Nitrospirales bacterium]